MSAAFATGGGGAGGSGGKDPRRLVFAGNWKMNLLQAQATAYCADLRRGLAEHGLGPDGPRVVLFPSHPLLAAAARGLAGSWIGLGGQDVHPADKGAHTGDVSAPQLADAGCGWVLCGHSERRRDHGESDQLVASKVAAAARHGLTPVLCVGETRAERDAGQAHAVLERQVAGGLASHPGAPVPLVVAYEPVWAIGTGLTASPDTAEEAHALLRRAICERMGVAPEAVTLLYGGSVTPDTAAALLAEPNVDGFLVGGASLDPRQFLAIITGSAGGPAGAAGSAG